MSAKPLVVFIGPSFGLSEVASICGDVADVVAVEPTAPTVASAMRRAAALIDASMQVPITDAMVAGSLALRVVSCASTGSNHVERRELSRRGISVLTLREDSDLLRNLTPAAEHTWALLLAVARQLVPASQAVLSSLWQREDFPGIILRGKRLGIVGCGRIGQRVAIYGRAFEMSVAGYDPHIGEWPSGIVSASLDEVMATSDVISVSVNLTEESRGLISRALLEKVKPGAIFINTSRGEIVDELALIDGLMSRRILGAGVDVVSGEPTVAQHPIVQYARKYANLVVTPHIAGFAPEAVALVCRRAAEKALPYLGWNHERH